MVDAYVDLYWLPLGAGGRFVRLNGRLYEAIVASVQHRERQALYHSALEVGLAEERYVIEMAPVWNERSRERGTVGEGAVGSSLLGRLRMFRYEIRCWHEGRIPDADEAVDSPRRLTTDPATSTGVLEAVPQVPTPVWGRDQLHTGDMWNSNSLVSWLLARNGLDMARDRAPGRWTGTRLDSRPDRSATPLDAVTGATAASDDRRATGHELRHRHACRKPGRQWFTFGAN